MNARAVLCVGTACAALAFAAGCVSRGVYPDEWAAKAESGSSDCPVIDGEYLNEGEYFEKVDNIGLQRRTTTFGEYAANMEYTADELAKGPTAAAMTSWFDRFRLQLVDETLHIRATGADGSELSIERPVRKSCSDSLMLVEADWWSSLQEEEGQELFGATLGMSMLARGSLKLGRAEDGSLLVRQSAVGSIMIFQWPVLPLSFTEWVRFPPAPATPAAEELAPEQVSQSTAQAERPTEGH